MSLREHLVIWACGLAACQVDVDGGAGLSAGMSPNGASAGTGVAADTGSDGAASSEDASSGSGNGSEAGAVNSDSITADAAGSDGLPSEGTTDGLTSGPGDTTSAGDDAPGDPLDPDLDVPDGGATCQTPGSLNECGNLEVCRFHTTEEGLCESCDVCGNLGAPCTQGTDCDILFACYQNQCTNICPLGTSYCGAVEDCLDVGHPTHGVCAPF